MASECGKCHQKHIFLEVINLKLFCWQTLFMSWHASLNLCANIKGMDIPLTVGPSFVQNIPQPISCHIPLNPLQSFPGQNLFFFVLPIDEP